MRRVEEHGGQTHIEFIGVAPTRGRCEDQRSTSSPVNQIAVKAIADLQTYWADEYPKLYGHEYEPVKGGFYAVIPSSGDLPPCRVGRRAKFRQRFPLPTKDVVAWDPEPAAQLQSKFGATLSS